MHRSLLSTFMIDVPSADLDATVAFWSGALGATPTQTKMPQYHILDDAAPPNRVVIQDSGPGEARIHFDIHTDDLEAEVARLEALGAKRVEKIKTWWVLEAPTGQRFCVVRAQRGSLGDDANTW